MNTDQDQFPTPHQRGEWRDDEIFFVIRVHPVKPWFNSRFWFIENLRGDGKSTSRRGLDEVSRRDGGATTAGVRLKRHPNAPCWKPALRFVEKANDCAVATGRASRRSYRSRKR